MKNKLFIIILVLLPIMTALDVHLYYKNKATENFIELVKSIEEERDTTYSLRNYEVLTDSLNNLILKWRKGDTSY